MSEADIRDEALVDRAQQGDREALVTLYHRYVAEIYGYLLNQLGDIHDAEDVTSETFVRVVAKLDTYRGQASFRTWLYTVARNQLRDHWRRVDRRPSTVELDPERATLLAEAPAEPNPRASELGQEVLARLPGNYRRVLIMRVLEGRSVKDTAQDLDLTVSNVKVLQHRGLKAAAVIASDIADGSTSGDAREVDSADDGHSGQEQGNGE